MSIAYFDCFAGIAGDMALGALLDCGVPLEELKRGLASLPVEGWDIEATPVLKSGIHALKVRITLHGEDDSQHNGQWAVSGESHSHSHAHHHHHHEHSHEHEHSHDEHHHHHAHEHHHEHSHSHAHDHHHEHEHHHGRSMAEIRQIIEQSTLNEHVKANSLAVFERIAQVEAKMHHSTPEEIHFHEIGGLDSLLDIVGVAWCLDYLGVDEIYCSALPHSTGFVNCAHGLMPVPAPATQELLVGVPMIPTPIRGEMVTPTGAGLMRVLAKDFGSPPAMTPQRVGFGAGTKDWPDRPNMVRVVIGEKANAAKPHQSTLSTASPSPDLSLQGRGDNAAHQSTLAALAQDAQLSGLEWRSLHVIESNIDDMNPEFFSVVMERLFEAGALDVWIEPVQMKKNRPAWQLGALSAPEATATVLASLLRETTTLGARIHEVQRAALPRHTRTAQTRFGEVRLKVAHWSIGNVHRAIPEWADVERLAREHNVTPRDVYEAAVAQSSTA